MDRNFTEVELQEIQDCVESFVVHEEYLQDQKNKSCNSWTDKYILSDVPDEELVKINCLANDYKTVIERINVSWSLTEKLLNALDLQGKRDLCTRLKEKKKLCFAGWKADFIYQLLCYNLPDNYRRRHIVFSDLVYLTLNLE